MTHQENKLTQFFSDILNNKSDLNYTNITVAVFTAIGGLDSSLNIAEVVFNMRNDIEYIYKVIDDLARSINKKSKEDAHTEQRQPIEATEYLTIPEIQSVYSISQQAIRKACNEGRLRFKEGMGKNKYLIAKTDADLYLAHSKNKHKLITACLMPK